MAQQRSKRMAIVLQLAEQAEQAAAEHLQQYRDQLNAAETQLQQLLDYQQEYIDQINAKQQLSAREMISDRSFIGQLDDAAGAQRQKLAQCHRDCDQAMLAWQQAYQKRNSIAELIDKMKLEENALMEKQLQKEIDELSSQALLRKN